MARTIVSTGTIVAMIDESMGDVSDRPHKKSIWLSWMPNPEAKNKAAISRRDTRSRGRRSEAVQKSRQAPTIR